MPESPFNKVAGLKTCNFIKETSTQLFSCEYGETLRTVFYIKHLRWLLVKFNVRVKLLNLIHCDLDEA